MCGIVGFVDFEKRGSEAVLRRMTDRLLHRGPDDGGVFFEELENVRVGLGHRRLSILDLSSHGHQPMEFEGIRIVYNGEVYNFKEIRKSLEKEGYSFDSDSDTEVILKSYHRWGLEALERFNGMFAIAIYDSKEECCYLIRDRSGIKPLYWYRKGGTILFASELKSLHSWPEFDKEIDLDAIGLFLQYQYIPEPHSVFRYARKLKAGYYCKIDLSTGEAVCEKYWDVIEHYNRPQLDLTESEALEETERLLKSAFEYRMVSDVPVGIFLSGGYDSSIVTALLQHDRSEKLKTFTIGFREKGYDESPHARKVAEYLGCDHTEYYCTQKEALEILPLLPEIYDEPFADSSAIPTILVSRLAKERVSVSLSADGGDELFAGYDIYPQALRYYRLFSKIPRFFHPLLSKTMHRIDPSKIPLLHRTYNFETRFAKAMQMLSSPSAIEALRVRRIQFTQKETDEILRHSYARPETNFDLSNSLREGLDDIAGMLAMDYKNYMLDDILTKVDRATMSVSLEGREPLLDYRLIEFAARLPTALKYKEGKQKYLLRKIAHKYLPKEIMERPKMGFGVPIYEWFRDELRDYFLRYLDQKRLEREAIFDAKRVVALRDRYLRGEAVNVEKLWSILIFEMWYERWM